MELKEGYKQTEVGVIPEDWEVLSLGELFSITVGGDLRKDEFSARQNSKYKFPIYANSLANKGLYGFSSTYEFSAESITVTARGDIGHAETRNSQFCAIGRLLVLSPIANCSCKFFSNFINCFISFPNENTGVPQLTAPQITKHYVAVPKHLEQKAIASVLSDVDALLSSLDALIAKKRDIKTAAMQELLTGKKRLPGFSGEWREDTIKNIAPLQRGYDLPLAKLKKGEYPVIGSNGTIFHHNEFKIKGPGVITGRSGTIGSVFFIEEDYWPHNTTLYVTNFYNNYPKFIYYLYNFCGFEQYSNGSGVPTLNRNDIHDIKIHIPRYAEQAAIAAVLSDMDAEISALESRRAKVQSLKQGMMQELLTGRTRLLPEGE